MSATTATSARTHSIRTLLALLALLAGTRGRANADELDSAMYRDPQIPVARVVKTFPEGVAELWVSALDRPEHDVRGRAALAIAQAHEAGLPGLAVAVPALLRTIDRPDEHPAVAAAAARALVALDARAAAPSLLQLAKSENPDLRDIVEPVLARWDYKPARDIWLARLQQESVPRRGVILAARCLGAVREERAAARLRELAMAAATAPPLRLAAAQALGEIRTSKSEADAKQLSGAGADRTSRLVAAALLRRHEGVDAVALLQAIARDADPSVASAAVGRLSELGPAHVITVLPAVMASEEAEVRGHGVAAMVQNPSDDFVRALARTLSDPHPDVRVRARRGLRELASGRRALVLEEASKVLGASDWRGQEQAAILLAQLDHKPAARRLVSLLPTNRSEVATATGWALRQLAVPNTLPKVLDHVKNRHAALLKSGPTAGLRGVAPEAIDSQLSQLIQFLGVSRYREADAALRALVPRILRPGMPPVFTPVGAETRTAAIWALGLFNEGKPAEDLVSLIESRLTGDGTFGRDNPRVRAMAAVTLARLGATQSLEALRVHSEGAKPSVDGPVNACRWAVGRLTGEAVPAPGVVQNPQRDWFLVPTRAP